MSLLNEFKDQTSDVIQASIEEYSTTLQQSASSSQATTLGGVEDLASHPETAPPTMPGYVDTLPESLADSDSDSESNAGLAGYMDADGVLFDDVEESFADAQI